MPCSFPVQATFKLRADGKRDIRFSRAGHALFKNGVKRLGDNNMAVPCGRCMDCRLERSRQMAVRCVHEAKLNEVNCFVTLTYSDKHLPEGNTLVRSHVQDFMKKLRQKFRARRVRVYGCGEYGDNYKRPHYHLCLFNLEFVDREKWYKDGDYWYYQSSVLDTLWGKGFSTVCDFSFDTAAYCARYCTKKVTGPLADDHYQGRKPEFSIFSNKPGIGGLWFDRFGESDIFPHDCVVSRGVKCKVPRYYDVLRERVDPDGFAQAKDARRVRAVSKEDDNSFDRLAVKAKCLEARFSKLVRKMEGA